MIHGELRGEIIGAVMEALNELTPGLDQKLYERALIVELKHHGRIIGCHCHVERSRDISNCF